MILRDYQLDVIERTRNSFKSGYNKPLIVLPCGAGKTVCFAYMANNHNGYVWFMVHRRELVQQTIDTFKKFNISMEHVYVGTIQSTKRPDRKPTLIIFDEAHHATAKTWKNLIKQYPNIPVVGLTATPHRMNGESLGHIFDTLINGISTQQLINQQYLSPYDYYIPKLYHFNVSMRGSDFNQTEFSAELMTSKIVGDVSKYLDFNRKTIIYSPSIQFSQHLASTIPGIVHFDGNTLTKQRDDIIQKFRSGEIRALSNVDLIGEGFDVPDCDTIMLLRPTMSLTLYIQQSMRALRYQPNKRAIIYDFVGNAYRHGLPSDEHIWQLNQSIKPSNSSGEPNILIRECHNCLLVYSGTKPICPHCNHDNGKTKQQIEQDTKAELELIQQIEIKQRKSAYTLEQLIKIGKQRNYKNPYYWAKQVLKGRNKHI